MQEKKKISYLKKENTFKSPEAQRFILEVQRIIDNSEGLKFAHIAKKSGFSSQDFTDIKSGKKDIRRNFLDAISELYPIDKNFILTGIKSKPENITAKRDVLEAPPEQLAKYEVIPQTNNERAGVPYYDVDFLGGFDLIHNNQHSDPSFYIDFLPCNDCDAWINMTGKSMEPLIAHGDLVALKFQPDWQRFLLYNEIYAIVTDNGFRTIKIIKQGPDKDHLLLVPYNKEEDYEPQVIPKDVITHIFRVKGNIKKFF